MRLRLVRLIALGTFLSVASVAQAQLSFGAGGGVGVGSRGKPAKGTHGTAYLQFKLPILPGARIDGMAFDVVSGVGLAGTANIVFSLPLPIITPYIIGGLGRYKLGDDGSANGWNIGGGVKVGLMGIGVFGEIRRHQRIARNLLTLGLAF